MPRTSEAPFESDETKPTLTEHVREMPFISMVTPFSKRDFSSLPIYSQMMELCLLNVDVLIKEMTLMCFFAEKFMLSFVKIRKYIPSDRVSSLSTFFQKRLGHLEIINKNVQIDEVTCSRSRCGEKR